jgi:cytoskeletal protein RodZ
MFFWSNLVAVAVALSLLLVVVHQQRLLNRRELMAADCMTQLRNALLRAENQVEEATRRNHALMQALTTTSVPRPVNSTPIVAHVEQNKPRKAAVTSPPSSPTATTTTAPNTATSAASKRPPDPAPVSAPSPTPAPAAQDLRAGSQLGLFGSDGDLVAKINTLQQQLSTSQERERHLRRQLNDSEVRYQKEREKSRSLQG